MNDRKMRYSAPDQVRVASASRVAIADDTRRHAVNYGFAYTLLSFVALFLVWFVVSMMVGDARRVLSLWPLPIVVGVVKLACTLVDFTEQYRLSRYADAIAQQRRGRGPQAHKPTVAEDLILDTQVMCPDGSFHPLKGVKLNAYEFNQLREYLLENRRFVVTAFKPLLGDTASLLRAELSRLGFTEKPRGNRATKVTAGGLIAIERWQYKE